MSKREEQEKYWHWLHGLMGIAPKEKEELLALCPEAEVWYEAGRKKQVKELLGPYCGETEKQRERMNRVIELLEDAERIELSEKSYERMKKEGICMTYREAENYPERLKHIFLPPLVLFRRPAAGG